MPVPQEKPEKAMALLPVADTSSNVPEVSLPEEVVRPRRHSSSLQGLLRFAMEATGPEDRQVTEFAPMDEERKKFLEDALKSMTIDVVELLQKQIKVLQKVNQIKAEDDIKPYEEALETILDYVDNIDIANDFHKIGGFMILYPCLNCVNPKIRSMGCELLAVLCQNNPYCQRIVLENEFVSRLLEMLEKEEDIQVIVKILYALGGIVRENPEGFYQLIHYNGLLTLLNTLKKNNETFIIKITFLLAALCRTQPDLKSRLLFLDYLPTLISLISTERSPSHEHVLSLLVALVEDDPTALAECRKPKYNLKDILQKYISNVRNKEECLEEEQYCKRLLHLLISGR